MLKSAAAALFLALLSSTSAFAGYAPCSTPSSTGTVWHVDAVNGQSPDNGGDGSAAHPWDANGLKAMFADGDSKPLPAGYHKSLLATQSYDHYPHLAPNGTRWGVDGIGFDATQVQPGDKVLLANGRYGDIGISGPHNVDPVTGKTKWITFDVETGAKPVLSTISVTGAQGFLFQHIQFVSTLDDGSALNGGDFVKVSDGGTAATATLDIEFNADVMQSATAMPTQINADGSYKSGWTQAQWNSKVRNGAQIIGSVAGNLTQCVSMTNNTIRFVTGGVAVSQAEYTTVWQNDVDYFVGDAFDAYSTSLVTFSHNYGLDRVDDGNGTHTDSLQLAFNGGNHSTAANPWHDIVIQNNTFIRLAHPDNPFPGYLQGIFLTNDAYDKVIVTENVIVTAACAGITITATNSLVANNTVVRDGTPASFSPGCSGLSIAVGGVGSRMVNNVVTGSIIDDCNALSENNLAISTVSGGVQAAGGAGYICIAGVRQFVGAGTFPGLTVLPAINTDPIFTAYNPPTSGLNSTNAPNLRPIAGSILTGAGVAGPGIPTGGAGGGAWSPPNIGAF